MDVIGQEIQDVGKVRSKERLRDNKVWRKKNTQTYAQVVKGVKSRYEYIERWNDMEILVKEDKKEWIK